MQDIYAYFHAQVMDADRIPYLVGAIFLTMIAGIITGPVAGNANSFFWGVLDIIFGRIGDRMDRISRSRSDLMLRGFVFCSILLFWALFTGQAITNFLGPIEELIIISLCLTSGSVWYMMLKLYFAMAQKGNVAGAYYGLSRSSRVDLNSTDDFGITRVALSFSAISFCTGLVTPGLWYLIGGIPLLLVYSALSYVVWRHGKCGFTKGFGTVPLALDKIMGFIPALFTGFLFSAASAVTPTAKMIPALLSWWSTKGKAPYEEGGVVLSAVAWPLNVSLGGPVQDLSGSSLKKSWIGPEGASAQLDHKHLQRGIYINVTAHILFVLALLAAYIYAGRML